MANKDYQNIIYEKKPPIAYVTLNRPEKMNAISRELQAELEDALEDAGYQDNEVKVIVIKGAGRCFSAGFDISVARQYDAVQATAFLKQIQPDLFWNILWTNPKPLIAQVHGFCVAAGMAVSTFCDLTICSEDALFGAPEVRGGGPFLWGIWPWVLGMKKARELLYTGNLIDAQEAWRLGLVNKVVPRDRLEEEVNKMAQTIAKVPVISNRYSKKLVNMAYELMGIRAVMDSSDELEGICNSATSAESSPERAEFHRLTREKGLTAALEWRKSRFSEEDAWWKEPGKKP